MTEEIQIRRYLSTSVLLHLLFILLITVSVTRQTFEITEEIYSVSVETGAKLGGISRVPEKKDFEKPLVSNLKKDQLPKELKPEEKKQLENLLAEPESKSELFEPTKPPPAATTRPTPHPTPTKKLPPTPRQTPTTPPTPRRQPKTNIDTEYSNILREYLGESSRAGGDGIGAARIGPDRGYGGGIIKDPEWIRYRDTILESVKRNWFWHDKSSNLQAIVTFNIAPDGKILNPRLKRSSGDAAFDQSCLKAVISTDRLPPPPQRFYMDFETVDVSFIPREMFY